MAPPPTPSAADAAAARDQVEEQANLVYMAALAWVALHDSGEDPSHDVKLTKTARTMAATLWRAMRRWAKTPDVDQDQWVEEQVKTIARRAATDAQEHAATVTRRMRREDPDVTDRQIASAVRGDTEWASAASRTRATKDYAEAVIEMHPWVEEVTGEPHSKLWISRGDPKVRTLHRTLHGRVRPIDDPFHTDAKTGKDLRYPADPSAAPGDAINCRCVLFLVPTAEKTKAEELFHVDDEQFDVAKGLAASGVRPFLVERAEREWRSELARRYAI